MLRRRAPTTCPAFSLGSFTSLWFMPEDEIAASPDGPTPLFNPWGSCLVVDRANMSSYVNCFPFPDSPRRLRPTSPRTDFPP